MTELKCPVCNTVLDRAFLTDKVCGCPKCKNIGNIGLWELFADTKKKLDIAVETIRDVKNDPDTSKETTDYLAYRLEQINQKEQQ